MHPCPACAAPLDDEGICTSCGALTRGFFRELDLGTPQIAEAVSNGLDFYRLLGVTPDADVRSVARRYRQLRVLFPDDPSGLATEPARRLALLERAGRVLTDPELRRTYEELRAGGVSATNAVLRCSGCAAPLPADAARCAFCGTPRAAEQQAPAAPPAEGGPPATEPVDYYALLGLTAEHLTPPPSTPGGNLQRSSGLSALARLDWPGAAGSLPLPPQAGPPSRETIEAAGLARERQILLAPGYTSDEREARLAEIAIARRILRDDQRRSTYDMLLLGFRQGLLGGGRLESLSHLQELARADMAEERGETLGSGEGAALLKQGLGYLSARLPREAISPLRRAVAALPRSAHAHAAYAQAILLSDDPLALGGHALRQALQSIEALEQLSTSGERSSAEEQGFDKLGENQRQALAALCRGLLARDQGDPMAAQAELEHATSVDSRLAPAWRGLAALALARRATEDALRYCGRALAIDRRDERALMLAIGACLRAGKRTDAREFARQVAAVRGEDWSAEAVLDELGQ
jgi:curved DNA-binding protein CbpA